MVSQKRLAAFPAYRLQEKMISNFSDFFHPKRMTCFELTLSRFYIDYLLISPRDSPGQREMSNKAAVVTDWLQTIDD